jgi:hypothetical protein
MFGWSLLLVKWSWLFFHSLKMVWLSGNQLMTLGWEDSIYHCWSSSMFLMTMAGSLELTSMDSPLSLTLENVYSS